MTLTQVKLDILEGRSELLFYGASVLWWTHLVEDLEEATERAVDIRVNREKFLEAKRKKKGLKPHEANELRQLSKLGSFEHQIPLDPTGGPVLQINAKSFIDQAEANVKHFGLNGLNALMFAHHRNCVNIYRSWSQYNIEMKRLSRFKDLNFI